MSANASSSLRLDKMMHVWTKALNSPQLCQQLPETEFNGWQVVVGVSSAVAWQQFMAALLRVQCQVSECSEGDPVV